MLGDHDSVAAEAYCCSAGLLYRGCEVVLDGFGVLASDFQDRM